MRGRAGQRRRGRPVWGEKRHFQAQDGLRGINFEGRAGKLKSEDGFGREREVFFTVAPFCGEKGLFGKKTAVEQGKSREKRTDRK